MKAYKGVVRKRRSPGRRPAEQGCHANEYPNEAAAQRAAKPGQHPYRCFDHNYEVWHLPRKGKR